MRTLYELRNLINKEFILLESDLLYEKKAVEILMQSDKSDVILSSDTTNSGDEVYIEIDEDNNLVNLSKDKTKLKSIYSELVGITKLSYNTYKNMCSYTEENLITIPKMEYENCLLGISQNNKIYIEKVDNLIWCEIDNEKHLTRAKFLIYPQIINS